MNHLPEDESRHCIKVLRKKVGDRIQITDGLGCFYYALITNPSSVKCEFSVQSEEKIPAANYYIHIAISPTKSADRIEWMVEKCVEIGIDEISLLHCKNTERKKFRTDRLEKIAITAMKQSHRSRLPRINPLLPVAEFIKSARAQDSKFIAHVDNANPIQLIHAAKATSRYVVLIGPEGDFSTSEISLAIKNDFKKVSLGDYRLRTETAGLYVCSVLHHINR